QALRRVPPESDKAAEVRRLRYNVARIYAQVARQVARDPAQQNTRGSNKALDYQEQALRLITGVLASLPDESERQRFWQDTIAPDRYAALNPIHESPRFKQLAAKYDKPSK